MEPASATSLLCQIGLFSRILLYQILWNHNYQKVVDLMALLINKKYSRIYEMPDSY